MLADNAKKECAVTQTAIHPARTRSKFAHRSTTICSIAVLACLFVGSASGQVWVTDRINTAQTEAGFASQLAKTVDQYKKQIEQYTTQLQQYTTQLQQYQQMLSSIQGLSTGLSLTPNSLQPITDSNSLIQAKCSGAGTNGILGSALNSLTSLVSQSIVQSQQQICAQIVQLQIHKYNTTVDVLNRVGQYGNLYTQVETTIKGVTTVADSERAANQAKTYSNALTTDMSNWQAQMNADDSIITNLQNMQGILANRAMRGGNDILGNVVQATAFAAAFH